MSGICGIVTLDDQTPDDALLDRMAQHLMRSRGHVRTLITGRCGLAYVGEEGPQPLTTTLITPSLTLQTDEAKTDVVSIVLDGDLYTHNAVAEALKAQKHTFNTSSPAEMLTRSYLHYGIDSFMKPHHGQFAFAMWDHTHQRLLLGRDQLGHRPLYYIELPNAIVFASEVKALLSHPDVPKQLNTVAIPYYLTVGHAPTHQTLFMDVKPVPPAHILVMDRAETVHNPYWLAPTAHVDVRDSGEKVASDKLLYHLQSVLNMMRRDHERVGIYLEGGLNSSVLLATLIDLAPESVLTFSTPPLGGIRSEQATVIRKVRARFATVHHDIPAPTDILNIIDTIAPLYDEPFGDPAAVIAYDLTKKIGDHVPVLLVSNGGDELFAGYEDFRVAQIAQQYDRLPDIAQRAIGEAVDRLPTRQGFGKRLSQVTTTASLTLPERYLDWIRIMSEEHLNDLVGKTNAQAVGHQYASQFSEQEPDNMMAALLEISLKTSLPHSQLRRLDYTSHAARLPIRTPFLDHRLVSFASRLPPSLKLKRGTSRYILRQTFANKLPRRVLESKTEHGLPTPVHDWFRGPLNERADELLMTEQPLIADLFDVEVVRAMIHAHRAQKAQLGHELWAILMLEMWMQYHFA